VQIIGQHYKGKIDVAKDLQCFSPEAGPKHN